MFPALAESIFVMTFCTFLTFIIIHYIDFKQQSKNKNYRTPFIDLGFNKESIRQFIKSNKRKK